MTRILKSELQEEFAVENKLTYAEITALGTAGRLIVGKKYWVTDRGVEAHATSTTVFVLEGDDSTDHTHANKTALDKLTDSNGALLYDNNPIDTDKLKANSTGDIPEFLGKKIIAGTGITLTEIHPTAVTITDEEHATYSAFVAGETITSGSRFKLTAADCDTTDNYFAGVKGSAIVANDVFEDVSNTSAVYIGNGSNCTQIEIKLT